VGIVGAGAAGLGVARALKRAGYRNVTVLEREGRVGGKCCTFHDDGRSYELGAGVMTPAYANVRGLVREYGLRASRGSPAAYVHQEDSRLTWVPRALGVRGSARLAIEGARLSATFLRRPEIRRPGFTELGDLCSPFAEWAARCGLEDITTVLAPWFTGFGYGHLDEVPAAYVLKYVSLFGFPMRELPDVGYQGLWERVAGELDVRLGTRIRSIERRDGIVVHTDDRDLRFDALVVACPTEEAAQLLDLDDGERRLFGEVQYNDYHVVGATVRGLPRARCVFFADNLGHESAGRPMFWYRRWKDRDLVLFYALARPGQALDASAERVAEEVAPLGATIERVQVTKHWRYFPHVGPEAMRRGFYRELEALQGRRRTYYAGELLSFAAVEPVVAYSYALVQRFFAPV
jgi:predicted NAD/FAD-binding protein